MRLNIEITDRLQKSIRNHIVKNNLTIREFVTKAIEDEINTKAPMDNGNFVVGIICGGPSGERGISLNSARSVADHLEDDDIKIQVFYIDQNIDFYKIDRRQLYSNTPSDFDFKLSNNIPLSKNDFIAELRKVTIVFPLIHGKYGEDGQLQELLEKYGIPFVGSGKEASKNGFDKIQTNRILAENGFYTFPLISFRENSRENRQIIERFFDLNKLKKAIVKPSNGGSSIGVYCVYSHGEAAEKVEFLFKQKMSPVIVEPFCSGREFTVVLTQNLNTGKPVALLPSEIEMKYENYQIFDYRRKYLPTAQTRYHTPANFTDDEIVKIQNYAEEIYKLFGFDDFVRMDGWLLNDGRIWFSDINIASGMEQNSFVFQQSSIIGMSHGDFIRHVLKSACLRYNIRLPEGRINNNTKRRVNVLFGGANAERQISLMSGTNVWLKLLKSKKYRPTPYLLDKNDNVWYLPYHCTLNHTVEEIYENCTHAGKNISRIQKFVDVICDKLEIENYAVESPIMYTIDEFMKLSKEQDAFVFLGLHGGSGEDGTLQKLLAKNELSHNGSNEDSSRLGMDKYRTGQIIDGLKDETLLTAPKIQFTIGNFKNFTAEDYQKFWKSNVELLASDSFIIKPGMDGSSAGAVRIYNSDEFKMYIDLLSEGVYHIPANTFREQSNIVEVPSNTEQYFLLESFIETDEICVENNKIKYSPVTHWLELTIGVVEKNGIYHSFNPSITIAKNKILTIEEKFQGGTGVNITPPPEDIMSKEFVEIIKKNTEKAAMALGLENYARLDIFANTETKKIILIEANTLPALTPSTVIFHQALEEDRAMVPLEFLEKIIESATPTSSE
ncbi:MAG: hypothetical protein LBS34_02340 [Rickettsiales bacterium]|jgi:D-alanine--D-alanine ligase|nr:hypothetical protein [Rickettsiales bacterium]